MTQSLFARLWATVLLLVVTPAALALEHLEVDYLRPGVDLSQYTQVMIHPLDISRTKVIPPAWAEDQTRKDWSLSDKDIEFVHELFFNAMKSEIEQDARFKVVPFTGPGILELEVKILSLTPYAARGEKVMTKGSGEITVQAEFIDGASGDLLAVLSGDQTVGDHYQQASIDADRANAEQLFKTWGKRLLDALRAGQR